MRCYLSYLQKVASKSLGCGWCRRVGETWEISGGLKWCCLGSGNWIEPQMISLDWWPHLQTARVFLQERHSNGITTCMSIWILVRGSRTWDTVENAYGGIGQCSASPLRSLFWKGRIRGLKLVAGTLSATTIPTSQHQVPWPDSPNCLCFDSQIERSPAPQGETQATWDAFKEPVTNGHRVDVSLSGGHWVGVTQYPAKQQTMCPWVTAKSCSSLALYSLSRNVYKYQGLQPFS